MVGGEDVQAAKPSPEGVKFALEHLGSTPQETLYIGDSTVDAETAQNAGVDFAGVLNGMTTADELRHIRTGLLWRTYPVCYKSEHRSVTTNIKHI